MKIGKYLNNLLPDYGIIPNETPTIQSLRGGDASFVGFETGGILTENLKKSKNGATIILDELEKAGALANDDNSNERTQVTNMFLQAFEGAGIQNPRNPTKLIPTNNCIFICTTNYGQNIIVREREAIWNNDKSNLMKLKKRYRMLSNSFGKSGALIAFSM